MGDKKYNCKYNNSLRTPFADLQVIFFVIDLLTFHFNFNLLLAVFRIVH